MAITVKAEIKKSTKRVDDLTKSIKALEKELKNCNESTIKRMKHNTVVTYDCVRDKISGSVDPLLMKGIDTKLIKESNKMLAALRKVDESRFELMKEFHLHKKENVAFMKRMKSKEIKTAQDYIFWIDNTISFRIRFVYFMMINDYCFYIFGF